MDASDLDMLLGRLTSAFGVDHYAKGSPERERGQMVWEIARGEGYTKKDFVHALKRFIARQRFATWTPGDFFTEDRARVYPYSWFVEQTTPPKGSRANVDLIGLYRMEGVDKPVFGWKLEVGDRLPVWQAPAVAALALPAPSAPLATETQALIRETVDRGKLLADIEELELEVRRQQRENNTLRHRNANLTTELEQLQAELSALRAATIDLSGETHAGDINRDAARGAAAQ